MWIELSPWVIVALNVLGIPLVHIAISWWSLRLPLADFQPNNFFYQIRSGEVACYERLFRVRSWKDRLPDAGPWFSGFSKSTLQQRSRSYLTEFSLETCRGEFAHWIQLLLISLFIVWNPFPANLVIVGYAILSNLPCLISQRHTRGRLRRVLGGERY